MTTSLSYRENMRMFSLLYTELEFKATPYGAFFVARLKHPPVLFKQLNAE